MTRRDIVVRAAATADRAAVKAVLADTFETTWRPHITTASAERYLSADSGGRYVDANLGAFVVAELDGDIVGMVHRRADFVDALHVVERCQRMGVGHALMDRAEQEAKDAGFASVRLETDTFNEQSHAFYRARGYVEKDRYPDDEWDSGFTTILFEKRLR